MTAERLGTEHPVAFVPFGAGVLTFGVLGAVMLLGEGVELVGQVDPASALQPRMPQARGSKVRPDEVRSSKVRVEEIRT